MRKKELKTDWLKPKTIVTNGVWVGVVNDVYESPTSGQKIIELRWVKNSYQHTPFELIRLDERMAISLKPSTLEALIKESKRFREKAEQDAMQLIELVSH